MSKVKFNIKNIHLAIKKVGPEGAITYEKPIAFPGAVGLTMEAKGEASVFYADGVEYYKTQVNGGYDGELEAATVTDEIREKILKEIMDSKKVLLEDADAVFEDFALGFQIDGDTKNTRFWFYSCNPSRTSLEAKTDEEVKEPQTDTFKFSSKPESVIAGSEKRIVRAKTTDATDGTTYDDWFGQVYIPTMGVSA